MDNSKDVQDTFNHAIQIAERKNIIITGVKKLENFDSEEFFFESVMGYLLIKGNELELVKLDTFQGTLSIKGKINSLSYLEDTNKKEYKESFLSKLFK